MSWTIEDKTVLITGATSGIGLEAAVSLAQQGARLILAGRGAARMAHAVATVQARGGAVASSYLCDMSSQLEIRRLATEVARNHPQLHVLVNNAGGVNKRRGLTADGIERTFATNHLGSFLLTNLLLDLLKRNAPARVITVASISHRSGTMEFEDLGFERGYWVMRAYSRSKLANVLFANELARRLAGTGVTSNSLHPGRVATNIWTGAPLWTKPYIQFWLRPTFISAEAGGQTIVHLAASRELEGVSGQYFEKNVAVASAPLAQDVQLARRLWDVSAKLTNLRPAV